MTVDELPHFLKEKGIRDDSCFLNGTSIGEEHCIEKGPEGWSVFYHERGSRTSEQVFRDEEEAVALLISRLENDPTCYEDFGN